MKKSLFTVFAATMSAICMLSVAACGNKTSELEVVAPDGAPALALLNAISIEEKKEDDLFDFEVIDSNNIQAYVSGAAPKADFCVLPVNLAAKMLGEGTTYQMLGTVTHGNFYFLTAGDAPAITKENLATALLGKKVGVVQLPNVPGLTFKAVLSDNAVPFATLENVNAAADETKVNLVAFDPENVTPAGGCDYYLCPEPAASTKIKGTATTQRPFKSAGSLQELYGEGGYPQAVAVVKKSVIESNKEAVDTFITYLEGSDDYLASVTPETVLSLLDEVRTDGLKPSFSAQNLTSDVIANCSVSYVPSKTCKAEVTAFLQKLIGVSVDATALPEDAFFYMG